MLSDYQPMAWADNDDAWRPSPMTEELAAQLRTDSAMERVNGDDYERLTCFTHQSWVGDCIASPSHANPISKYNWCDQHGSPVQLCRCRPPTVEG